MGKIDKEFLDICTGYGFSRKGSTFSRCIGDGIFQTLSISLEHINIKTSKHLSCQEKSPYLKIGIWSMYSVLPSFYFSNSRNIGNLHPENLIGESFNQDSFTGIQREFTIMMSKGFDILDSISTQEQLVSSILAFQRIQYGIIVPHQFELCAPLLLCNNYDEARTILYGLYAQNWLNFHANNDHLKITGKTDDYIRREVAFDQEIQDITLLLRNVLGQRHDEIKQYLLHCLNQNILLARENKINFADGFFPLYKTYP